MTRAVQLLMWIATAGTAGVSSGAVAAWALRQGWTRSSGPKTVDRLQARGLVTCEHTGYRPTGQAVRLVRVTDRGYLTLGLVRPEPSGVETRRTA